jgi:hypothetical protein
VKILLTVAIGLSTGVCVQFISLLSTQASALSEPASKAPSFHCW